MAMTKTAHAEALKKIAEIDQRDANAACELGFAKAAHDLGLNEEQYRLVYAKALEVQKTPAK